MRIHCLENVDKALQFLKDQRVHLENMGSHDIVDGNPRLSLGLIWTIILRFQVHIYNNLSSCCIMHFIKIRNKKKNVNFRFKILPLKKPTIKRQNPQRMLCFCGAR